MFLYTTWIRFKIRQDTLLKHSCRLWILNVGANVVKVLPQWAKERPTSSSGCVRVVAGEMPSSRNESTRISIVLDYLSCLSLLPVSMVLELSWLTLPNLLLLDIQNETFLSRAPKQSHTMCENEGFTREQMNLLDIGKISRHRTISSVFLISAEFLTRSWA